MTKRFSFFLVSAIVLLMLSIPCTAQRMFSCGAHFRFDLKSNYDVSLCIKNNRLTTVKRTPKHDNSTLFRLDQRGCEFTIQHIQTKLYLACVNGKVALVKRVNSQTCLWSVYAFYCGEKPDSDKNDPNTYIIRSVNDKLSRVIDIYNESTKENAEVGLYKFLNGNNQKFYITESWYQSGVGIK